MSIVQFTMSCMHLIGDRYELTTCPICRYAALMRTATTAMVQEKEEEDYSRDGLSSTAGSSN